MKMVAGIIPLQNAVVTTHYLSSFWRFLWPVGKVQFAVEVTLCNCNFCNTTHVNKALVCISFYIPFINIFFTWGRWIRFPSTGLFNYCQQSKLLSLSYSSYNIIENWKQWMIIVNIYVSFIYYNRVIWRTMVSSFHNIP